MSGWKVAPYRHAFLAVSRSKLGENLRAAVALPAVAVSAEPVDHAPAEVGEVRHPAARLEHAVECFADSTCLVFGEVRERQSRDDDVVRVRRGEFDDVGVPHVDPVSVVSESRVRGTHPA